MAFVIGNTHISSLMWSTAISDDLFRLSRRIGRYGLLHCGRVSNITRLYTVEWRQSADCTLPWWCAVSQNLLSASSLEISKYRCCAVFQDADSRKQFLENGKMTSSMWLAHCWKHILDNNRRSLSRSPAVGLRTLRSRQFLGCQQHRRT